VPLLCLSLIVVSGGWLVRAIYLSRTQFSAPPREAPSADLRDLLDRANSLRRAGKHAEAAGVFTQGYKFAVARGQAVAMGVFLWGMGNCDVARNQHHAAIESFLAARKIFESRGDSNLTSSLDKNLASVFIQLGEYDAAIDAATRALAGLSSADPFGDRAKALLALADLQSQQGSWEQAQQLYAEAILAAGLVYDTTT